MRFAVRADELNEPQRSDAPSRSGEGHIAADGLGEETLTLFFDEVLTLTVIFE